MQSYEALVSYSQTLYLQGTYRLEIIISNHQAPCEEIVWLCETNETSI